VGDGLSQLKIQQALSKRTTRFTYDPDVIQIRHTITSSMRPERGSSVWAACIQPHPPNYEVSSAGAANVREAREMATRQQRLASSL